MEQEILVCSLGYHLDGGISSSEYNWIDLGLMKHIQNLAVAEQNRIHNALELAQWFGQILAWARRERLSSTSALKRVIATRLDQFITGHLTKLSKSKLLNINSVYLGLWELETLIDRCLDLVKPDSSLQPFISTTLQDSVTLDSPRTPLEFAKYYLFLDWMKLQQNLITQWICYCKLPMDKSDFWIEQVQMDPTLYDDVPIALDIWSEYSIIEDKLPHLIISETLGRKILFIGTAVKILTRNAKISSSDEGWLHRKIVDMFDYSSSHTQEANSVESVKKADTFRPFFGCWNVLQATAIVDEIAQWASKALFDVIKKKNHFHTYLQTLQDYFLMQDGSFFSVFFSLAQKLFASRPILNAEHDSNLLFQESSMSSQLLGADTKSILFSCLRLTFTPSFNSNTSSHPSLSLPTSQNSRSKTALPHTWNDLCLDMDVSWPIDLIITPMALRNYNALFQFLFQVKWLQHSLRTSWQQLKQINQALSKKTWDGTSKLTHRLSHRFGVLRHQMGFFMDTLEQYLHVDVFSCHINQLDLQLERSDSFEHINNAHQSFLTEVSINCFTSVPAFKRSFESIFHSIHQFCSLLGGVHASFEFSSGQTLSGEKLQADLTALIKDWIKCFGLLHTLLSGAKGQAPHLNRLLLLLDFNLFWNHAKSLIDLEQEHPLSDQLRSAHLGKTKRDSAPVVSTASSSSGSDILPASHTINAPISTTDLEKTKASGPRPELLARLMKKTR